MLITESTGEAVVLVLDEVAEVAVLLLADRRFEEIGSLAILQHLADLLEGVSIRSAISSDSVPVPVPARGTARSG